MVEYAGWYNRYIVVHPLYTVDAGSGVIHYLLLMLIARWHRASRRPGAREDAAKCGLESTSSSIVCTSERTTATTRYRRYHDRRLDRRALQIPRHAASAHGRHLHIDACRLQALECFLSDFSTHAPSSLSSESVSSCRPCALGHTGRYGLRRGLQRAQQWLLRARIRTASRTRDIRAVRG